MKRDVCAFTEPGSFYPAYLNISQTEEGDYVVTVRATNMQCSQSVTVPKEKMLNLSDDLHYEFHAGSGG